MGSGDFKGMTNPEIVTATLEAVLIEALEPPQNRRRGDAFRAVEFLQVEDPQIEKGRREKLLQELGQKV